MFICPHEDVAISHTIGWRPVGGVCDCSGLVCGQCGRCQVNATHGDKWTVTDTLPDGSPRTLTWRGSALRVAAGRALNIGRH